MTDIRKARPLDGAACSAIARAAYAQYVPLIGREPPPMQQDFGADIALGDVWVNGTPVVAYVVVRDKGERWLLENVAVSPDARGRGLGRALIAHVETMARAAGARSVDLYTHARMTANRRLYPALGYVETDRRVEEGLDRVFFRKVLRDGEAAQSSDTD
jgi:ribosomal protein S18 acetylase RimI-like enzyme